jgi:hypothetical protein
MNTLTPNALFATETKYNDYKDYYKRIEKKGSNVFLIDGGGEISRDENGTLLYFYIHYDQFGF